MNPKRISMALFLALIVSGLFTWMVSRKIDNRPAPSPVPEHTNYAAPSRALQAGDVLKPENLELVAWPVSSPLDGAHAKLADLFGRQVAFPLGQGEPILDRYLATAGADTGLAAKIPDGMRAIALRSDEVVGVAGFLEPGSHLDVLVTYHSGSSPEPVTATVLQNATVIAAGHQTQPDPEGKPSSVTVVTLLLTPGEAERAVLASTQGAIHFVLRNGRDSGRISAPPIQLSQLGGAPPPVAIGATRKVATASLNSYYIETIYAGDQPRIALRPASPDGGPKQ